MKYLIFRLMFNFWNTVWWWIVRFGGKDFNKWLEKENNILIAKLDKQAPSKIASD